MKQLLAALVTCGLGLLCACGPTTGTPEGGTTGEIRFNLDSAAPLASIAIRSVFDPSLVYTLDCQAPAAPQSEATCDQLTVLPTGVYQIVITSSDPDCRAERESYQVIVEKGQTVEVPITLVCGGGSFNASDENRPLIAAISFSADPSGVAANQYVCQACTPGTGNERMEVQVTDTDTACADLDVDWSAKNGLGADATATLLSSPQMVPGDPCRFSALVDAGAPIDDYTVSFSVRDDQDPTSTITFPVHLQSCACP